MLTKIAKYTDYNGNERTQTCYFNMTKAEILEFNMNKPNGVIAYITQMMNANRNDLVFATFKELILASYGERTEDGRFIKNSQLREAFACSEAYSEIFMEIVSNEDSMAAFVNGIMPPVSEEQRAAARTEMQDAMKRGELPMIPELLEKVDKSSASVG